MTTLYKVVAKKEEKREDVKDVLRPSILWQDYCMLVGESSDVVVVFTGETLFQHRSSNA